MLRWMQRALATGATPVAHHPSPAHRFRLATQWSREDLHRRAAVHPFWYHSFSFDTGETIRGQDDVGADINGYEFPRSMAGLRVLDVGTASGWFVFYFEQQGASVTAVDVRSDDDLQAYGCWQRPQSDEDAGDAGKGITLRVGSAAV